MIVFVITGFHMIKLHEITMNVFQVIDKTLSYCLSTDQKLVRVRPQVFHSLISSHQYYSTWDR